MNAADIQKITLAEAAKRLAEMPRILHGAIVDASPEELCMRPEAGSFCLLEHACHLRDVELEGYWERLRRILEEDGPELAQFAGDVVARERNYMAQDAHAAAAQFAIVRAALIERAESLTSAQMARTGAFAGRTITVCDLLAMMVEHDRGHREEIARLVGMRSPR